jgi:MFS family permease
MSGALTFFPIGALLIPFLAIRSGIKRLSEERDVSTLRNKRSLVLSLALTYAFFGTLLSFFATGSTVGAPFYLVFPILFLVASVSGFIASNLLPDHQLLFPWQRGLKVAWIAMIAMVGFGALIFAASLAFHFTTVLQLTQVIEPGIFGGLAFLAIQILYLPNFAVAALSYVAGSGVVIGSGSWLNPFVHRIDEIPAIPLLGGLPIHPHPYLAILIVALMSLGAFIAMYGSKKYSDPTELKRFLISTIGFVTALTLIFARASSGELLSSNLSSVGPQWWLMPILIGCELGVGAALFIFLPIVITKIKESRNVAAQDS